MGKCDARHRPAAAYYRPFHEEGRQHIRKPPSDYLKTQFYYDTVNFDPGALRLAIEFAGAGHLLAGSDYPHQLGSMPSMVSSLHNLLIDDADRQAILGDNATRFLALGGTGDV